jgi:hypothetical protein
MTTPNPQPETYQAFYSAHADHAGVGLSEYRTTDGRLVLTNFVCRSMDTSEIHWPDLQHVGEVLCPDGWVRCVRKSKFNLLRESAR